MVSLIHPILLHSTPLTICMSQIPKTLVSKNSIAGYIPYKMRLKGIADGQFMRPSGIDLDSLNNVYILYIVDNNTSSIQKFDSNGTFLIKWGTFGTSDGKFLELEDIEIDPSDKVYVYDRGTSSIQKFTIAR
jgi:tripartite motif-containing protein 71